VELRSGVQRIAMTVPFPVAVPLATLANERASNSGKMIRNSVRGRDGDVSGDLEFIDLGFDLKEGFDGL
jgi:hypothetical protein